MTKMVKNPVTTFEEELRLHMKVYARRLEYTDISNLPRLSIMVHDPSCIIPMTGCPGHGKSWNLGRLSSRPGKSWKMMIMSWNFYYCTEQFCKSDTTSFIKSNYEPFYLFNNGTTSRWNCHY